MLSFVKDVDAALMRPDAALRAVQITTGFFENFLQSFEHTKIVISDQNDPICQGCGRGPDAALIFRSRNSEKYWFYSKTKSSSQYAR